MVKVRDIIEAMENWAPSSLAESWDNTGLITGDQEQEASSIIITLDVTEKTIENAASKKSPLIITHHPPIFKPLKNLSGSDLAARVIRSAVKNDVAIYASHTNLDQAPGGVSETLAKKLRLQSISPLYPGKGEMLKFITFTPPEYTDRVRKSAGAAGAGAIGEYRLCSFTTHGSGTYLPTSEAKPFEGEQNILSRVDEDRIEMIVPARLSQAVVEAARKAHPYDEMAYDLIPLSNRERTFCFGAKGKLEKPMSPDCFLEHVSQALDITSLTATEGSGESIEQVAVMGGSGKSGIGHAVSAGADAYVTGDLGYHDFLEYGHRLMLVDATHRATELPVLDMIKERLAGIFRESLTDITIDRGISIAKTIDYTSNSINYRHQDGGAV